MRGSWGILTGVKPVKLTRELFRGNPYNGRQPHSEDEVRRILIEEDGLSEDKADLLIEIYKYQQEVLQGDDHTSAGVYIGIPFCPTRCLYCSFTSNQKPQEEIKRYLEALHKEISYVGRRMRETGLGVETLYIGGGTPTTMDRYELRELLDCIRSEMDISGLREFTLEAGRPDTIDPDKMKAAYDAGVTRISINPQTMKQETLDIIGRRHTVEDIYTAFQAARESGIRNINCDLIAGLPKETPGDFADSLSKVLELGPTDITIHTLALKRASRLIQEDSEYHLHHAEAAREMIEYGADVLRKAGYRPYYLYRLKRMAGALENTGWCREGSAGIYNIRIMDEQQSIVALGAGGMSKVYFPRENRLERVPNVSNYEVYIDRLDEMLHRKETGIFDMVPEIYKQSEDLKRR